VTATTVSTFDILSLAESGQIDSLAYRICFDLDLPVGARVVSLSGWVLRYLHAPDMNAHSRRTFVMVRDGDVVDGDYLASDPDATRAFHLYEVPVGGGSAW
jgi:hypothetical protein